MTTAHAGRRLGIYAPNDLCGAGLPLWLPDGTIVRDELERFVVELERAHGYRHVHTPQLGKRELYERSGHWAHYHEDMYPPMAVGSEEVVLRPMLCPHHILVFETERPSAAALPYRLAEVGEQFRFERSGVVGGLIQGAPDDPQRRPRVLPSGRRSAPRSPTCWRWSARPTRCSACRRLGCGCRGAARAPSSSTTTSCGRAARPSCATCSSSSGCEFDEAEGEAAFYGPKIDLQVRDSRGREETLSTIQVDFHLPRQFDLAARDGDRVDPAGDDPPLDRVDDGAHGGPPARRPRRRAAGVAGPDPGPHPAGGRRRHRRRRRGPRRACVRAGLRVSLDDRDASLAARVRAAEQARVPYVAVVGRREAADGTVAVRVRDGVAAGADVRRPAGGDGRRCRPVAARRARR